MQFRKDINGLRAIAIIGVIAFHFRPELLPGGFSGVDVFFVISGFLMTKIIFDGIQSNKFSLLGFYSARCRRIIPALTVLCFVLMLFGWFSFNAKDFDSIAVNGVGSIFFLSNVLYWSQSSYFGAEAHSNWLLHTWSLSVEWQFYLVYPIIILAATRIKDAFIAKILVISIMIISLACSIFLTARWPTMSFYLLITRSWEMMAGGIAYFIGCKISNKFRKTTELLGITLILFSYLYFTGSDAWPGFYAVVPVLGALLIIIANNNSIFTGNFLFQNIGNASYSIYLWHWPVVAYLHSRSLANDDLSVTLGVFASIVLGFISYFLIEKRSKSISITVTLSSAFALALAMFAINRTNGADIAIRGAAKMPKSIYTAKYNPATYLESSINQNYLEKCNFFDAASFKHKEKIDSSCTELKGQNGIFIWGDSHAQALGVGIRNEFTTYPVYQIASSSCRPGIAADTATGGEFNVSCNKSNEEALRLIKKVKPAVVVLAQRENHELNDYKSIIKELKFIGVKSIIVVGPMPQYDIPLPVIISERYWDSNITKIDQKEVKKELFNTDLIMKGLITQKEGVKYVSLLDGLCENGKCVAKVDSYNTPLQWDTGHLTPEGSYYITNRFLYDKIKMSMIK